MIVPHSTIDRTPSDLCHQPDLRHQLPTLGLSPATLRRSQPSFFDRRMQPALRKAIFAKAIVYLGPDTDYLPRRQRIPEGGKSSRRLRLYWRSVEKEIRHRDRPHHRRPKHFNKRISVLRSNKS